MGVMRCSKIRCISTRFPAVPFFQNSRHASGARQGDRGRVGSGPGREGLDGVAFSRAIHRNRSGIRLSQRVAHLDATAGVLKADDVGQPGELPDDLGPVILDRQGVAVPHVDEDSHSHGRGHPVHVLVDTPGGRAAVRRGKQHEGVHAGLLRVAGHLQGQLIAARHSLDDRHLSLGSLHRRPAGSLVLLQGPGRKVPPGCRSPPWSCPGGAGRRG